MSEVTPMSEQMEPDEQDYQTAEVLDAAIAQGRRSQPLVAALSPQVTKASEQAEKVARELIELWAKDYNIDLRTENNRGWVEQVVGDFIRREAAALTTVKQEGIEQGKREQRKRDAKIAETPYDTGFDDSREPAISEEDLRRGIAAAIREGEK